MWAIAAYCHPKSSHISQSPSVTPEEPLEAGYWLQWLTVWSHFFRSAHYSDSSSGWQLTCSQPPGTTSWDSDKDALSNSCNGGLRVEVFVVISLMWIYWLRVCVIFIFSTRGNFESYVTDAEGMVDEYVLPFIFSVSYCVLSHAMHLDRKACLLSHSVKQCLSVLIRWFLK